MFVPDFKNAIPGYTGHRPDVKDDSANVQQKKEPIKQIPGKYEAAMTILTFLWNYSGYGGYIPGIKSENVFGETYGKTSLASSSHTFSRGLDNPPHVKYNTTMKSEFLDNAERAQNVESVATLVGVNRGEDMYKKVSIVIFSFVTVSI